MYFYFLSLAILYLPSASLGKLSVSCLRTRTPEPDRPGVGPGSVTRQRGGLREYASPESVPSPRRKRRTSMWPTSQRNARLFVSERGSPTSPGSKILKSPSKHGQNLASTCSSGNKLDPFPLFWKKEYLTQLGAKHGGVDVHTRLCKVGMKGMRGRAFYYFTNPFCYYTSY